MPRLRRFYIARIINRVLFFCCDVILLLQEDLFHKFQLINHQRFQMNPTRMQLHCMNYFLLQLVLHFDILSLNPNVQLKCFSKQIDRTLFQKLILNFPWVVLLINKCF